MGKLFGTDGIRGVAIAYPIDVETAIAIGRAIAGCFLNDGALSNRHMVIGQDTRLSGDMLAQAVAAGACSAGLDVWHLGGAAHTRYRPRDHRNRRVGRHGHFRWPHPTKLGV